MGSIDTIERKHPKNNQGQNGDRKNHRKQTISQGRTREDAEKVIFWLYGFLVHKTLFYKPHAGKNIARKIRAQKRFSAAISHNIGGVRSARVEVISVRNRHCVGKFMVQKSCRVYVIFCVGQKIS